MKEVLHKITTNKCTVKITLAQDTVSTAVTYAEKLIAKFSQNVDDLPHPLTFWDSDGRQIIQSFDNTDQATRGEASFDLRSAIPEVR